MSSSAAGRINGKTIAGLRLGALILCTFEFGGGGGGWSVTCERGREAGGAGKILARDGAQAQPLLLMPLLLMILMPFPANS
jgi:hypothetical protein